MRILLLVICLLILSSTDAYAQTKVWDSGVVKVYNESHQNVWTAQVWSPCPAPLQMYQCPERIFYVDLWVNALAQYETEWVACNPNGTDIDKYFCLTSYIRYAAYLHPFIDRFPGTFELKPPKPLPSCLQGVGC